MITKRAAEQGPNLSKRARRIGCTRACRVLVDPSSVDVLVVLFVTSTVMPDFGDYQVHDLSSQFFE